ncbi:MAG TPA: TonB-dependent receptor, partial [Porticoccaceae bacterium]
ARGWGHLMLCDVEAGPLDALAAELRGTGARVSSLAADLAAADFPDRLLAALNGDPISALIHTAGLSPAMGSPERILSVNLDATVRLVDAVRDHMAPGSAAILFASNSTYFPMARDDRDVNFSLNMEAPAAFGMNSLTVKAGIDGRFKQKEADVDAIELRRTPDANLAQFTTSPYSHGLADMGEGISSAAFMSFYNQNQSLFTQRPQDVDENTELSLSQDFTADEDVTAAYMMGTWDLDRLRIIAGGRVERTEYSARGNELVYGVDGALSVNARNVNSKYTDFLPGLHVRYEPTDDLVIRARIGNINRYSIVVEPEMLARYGAYFSAKDPSKP